MIDILSLEETIYNLYIVQGLTRSQLCEKLSLTRDVLKRKMKLLGIKRRSIRVCIELDCNLAIFSKARCRKHYRIKFEAKRRKRKYYSSYQKQYYLTHRDLYFNYKQSRRYKLYQVKYNHSYRLKRGALKRPAIYWRNRWIKIQESNGCSVCHTKETLEAHHIKPVKQCKLLNWSDDQTHSKENLLILCKTHHRSKDINRELHKENRGI